MATPRRNSPRSGTRPQSGDATGREKARQMAAAAPAIREAALTTTLINAPVQDAPDMVVDYSQGAGEFVREIDPAEFALDPDVEIDEDDGFIEQEPTDDDRLPSGRVTGFEEPEEVLLDEPQPKHGRPGQRRGGVAVAEAPVQTVTAEKPFRRMRVNEDLDNVTIGKDPQTGDLMHYSFRNDGTWYKVPRHVYDHLDRLGYVYH